MAQSGAPWCEQLCCSAGRNLDRCMLLCHRLLYRSLNAFIPWLCMKLKETDIQEAHCGCGQYLARSVHHSWDTNFSPVISTWGEASSRWHRLDTRSLLYFGFWNRLAIACEISLEKPDITSFRANVPVCSGGVWDVWGDQVGQVGGE